MIPRREPSSRLRLCRKKLLCHSASVGNGPIALKQDFPRNLQVCLQPNISETTLIHLIVIFVKVLIEEIHCGSSSSMFSIGVRHPGQ